MDKKSPDAFRTISEVADWLGVPTHVLRFWESRFTQVKPVKRAGGRRYYRPADMELLGGIRKLLHEDGMTIRGAQKLLREHGVKHVAAMSRPLDSDEMREEAETNVVLLTTQDTEEQEKATPEVVSVVSEPALKAPMDVDQPESAPADKIATHAENDIAIAEPQQFDDAPEALKTEPDLFSAAHEMASEMSEESVPEQELALPEPDLKISETDGQTEEVVADMSATKDFDPVATDDTKLPEPTPADAETPEEQIATAPAPIDLSHIAPDAPDDAGPMASDTMPSAQLRAFRAGGGTLSDDALRDLTARLTRLAARMPAATTDHLADNGQVE